MKLSRAERKAIFAGGTTALKRERKPDVKAGERLFLAWSRGGKQFVGRTEQERLDNCGATIEIPRKPTVWIEFKEPTLKDGRWVIEFEAHDEREPVRLLSRGHAGASRESGLKTRWAKKVDSNGEVRPKKVPRRGEQVEHHTAETERGYGGSGKAVVDEREAVDDAWLAEDRIQREVDLKNARLQEVQRQRAKKFALESRVAETRKRKMTGTVPIVEAHLTAVSDALEQAA